jgi:hypothetical protein
MIIFVSGKPRTGKTLLISMLANVFADSGFKVHANLSLFGKGGKGEFIGNGWTGDANVNARIISLYDLVLMMEKGRVSPNQIICMHEIYGFMNSHKSLSDIVGFGEAFVCQSAKLGYDWLIDSQIVMKVDDVFRKLADFRYESEKDTLNKVFRYHKLDVSQPDKNVRTDEQFTIPFVLARYYWNRYDTYTSYVPVGMAEMKIKMEALEPQLMNARIENQVALILKNRFKYGLVSPTDINTTVVKDALIQLGEPVAFYGYVSNRLKLKLKYNIDNTAKR